MSQPLMLIAVEAEKLDRLLAEVSELRAEIRAVRLSPRPEWVTAHEYAEQIGRTTKTVSNLVKAGKLESKRQGRTLLIRSTRGDQIISQSSAKFPRVPNPGGG
ncbi:hypothetical protein JJJ17_07150 [Paracoccus caeni]|uniref:Helix-turn-helix domain-containing protein n=1 Tax=Paracoccus caeni TaxID=657651 RepID=A0A934SEV3_9RHOB|nr:hypothetical protein [Paracoccus caeni]MBK4215696.1 hypothetical protein [Paracoccus caeni]